MEDFSRDLIIFQDANSVPEVFLKDLRDYTFHTNAGDQSGGGYIQAGYYRVRKLADGNCWMTENLDHPQQTGHYYYNWDTDLNSKDKWAPTANFIDGTVEGTDIHTGIVVNAWTDDYTYYGNGCPNEWNESIMPTRGGSATACSSRLVETNDGETQKNGTYYVFASAVAGLSDKETVANSPAPDSFCPLGWQLPYRGTGGDYYEQSKYWDYLLSTYQYQLYNTSDGAKFRSYPFSYVFGGFYRFNIAYLYDQGVQGRHWTAFTASQLFQGRRLDLGSTIAYVNDNKVDGDSIRCVTRY